MLTAPPVTDIRSLRLSEDNRTPLFKSLYRELRGKILAGELKSGSRLPPSRTLSQQLGVSRNTVIAAYNQLLAEGYLCTRTGAGTFVASDLPDQWLRTGTVSHDDTPSTFTGTTSRYAAHCADKPHPF